jgi:hypothetical protein
MPYSNIEKPSKYFTAKTFTGTGASQSITGLEFSPDFVWLKSRSTVANHYLYDIIRGANNQLLSNATSAESTVSDRMTAFNSDGFTVGSSSEVNGSGNTTVAWTWDANGTGVSNTAGTISSTVSANTTSGFSIVNYTGTASNATVGHGLGVTPAMIIVKKRGGTSNWNVYHKNLTSANYYLILNDATGQITTNDPWNNTAPTSTVFSIKGTAGDVNTSATTHIAYCFAEVKGYSKFSSYTGNGSTDGTFVYTGFSPAFVMVKSTSAAGTWCMFDNKRSSFNEANKIINAEDSAAEFTATGIDFTSNGFKHRNSNTNRNASGVTFIYMAFAENPFTSSKGIPCTAR